MSELQSNTMVAGETIRPTGRRRRGLKAALVLHRLLAWFAGAGLLLWGLSGLLHPLMTTFGPQQSVYRPPAMSLNLQGMLDPGVIAERSGIATAVAVQVVSAEMGLVLQVTEASKEPRRYFDVHTGDELPEHDQSYATYLARHYLGESAAGREVSGAKLQTAFDLEYPLVNRLLPVWRVDFTGDDGLTAYVHTETASLAAVNDDLKRILQTGFQWFHTWDWMPEGAGVVRASVITLLVGSIFCLAGSGVVMLFRIQRKGRAPRLRGWHRLGAWVLVLPLLALSGSGLYHLWTLVIDPPQSFLRHGKPLDVEKLKLPLGEQWHLLSSGLEVNRLSVVRNALGDVLYRLGLNPLGAAPRGESEIRSARFAGVPTTGPAIYVDASTGEVWEAGDKAIALELGDIVTGHPRSTLLEANLVTGFGMDYDFRNKRVPVWRLTYGEPFNTTYFVDTATGVLVDAVEAHEQPERLIFALLHKWNFLMMFGRDAQNIIISLVVIAAIVFLAIPGLRLRSRKRSPQ